MTWPRVVFLVSTLMLCSVGLLSAATAEELSEKALGLMQAGKPSEAREVYLRALEKRPESSIILYNLACCESLLGNIEQSRQRLVEAWDAGFSDIELVKSDPDLSALRDSREGRRLLRKLEEGIEEELRRFGLPQLFEAPVLGTSRVVPPPEVEEGTQYPLVVVLHGHGARADFIVGMFTAAGLTPPFYVVAPYAPYAIPQGESIGYSWFPPVWLYREVIRGYGEGEAKITSVKALNRWEEGVSEAYVLAAIDRAVQELPVEPSQIVLLGHSQGGVLGYKIALKHPELFRGLVVVGSTLQEQDRDAEFLARASGKLKVLICHSPQDEAVSIEQGKTASRALREAEIEADFVRYSGGHGLSMDLIKTIGTWIEKAVKKEE